MPLEYAERTPDYYLSQTEGRQAPYPWRDHEHIAEGIRKLSHGERLGARNLRWAEVVSSLCLEMDKALHTTPWALLQIRILQCEETKKGNPTG